MTEPMTREQLAGLAQSILDGTRVPEHIRVEVVVTDLRNWQQGEARKSGDERHGKR